MDPTTRGPAAGRSRRAGRVLSIVLGALAMAVCVAPSALAADPVITRLSEQHFSTVQHFDGSPECGPGATEYATGNNHLQIVDLGDSVHVTFGETFQVLTVPDDPAAATILRRGTDAGSFNLSKNGTTTFHESFRDFGTPWGDIQFFQTFVYANGQVVVDHVIARDSPPPGC